MGERARVADLGQKRSSRAQEEFAAIVRQHQAMVFSLALRFIRDREAAEEIAQDVFLDLYRNLETLKSPEHVVFWLRRVTSHRCIDHARRRKRPVVGLDDTRERPADGSDGDPMLARRLRQLIGSLPEKARMVVILRYQEDLTPLEIADILEMPVATVKSHLQRSLAMLREKIARTIGDVRK